MVSIFKFIDQFYIANEIFSSRTKKMLLRIIFFEFEKLKLKICFLNTVLPFAIRQNAYLKLQF